MEMDVDGKPKLHEINYIDTNDYENASTLIPLGVGF